MVETARRFGNFVLLAELGRGGMGIVYKAWDTAIGRYVAIKILSGIIDHETLARFRREAQTAGKLHHPNIAAVYAFDVANNQPYIAMQFIDGRTLEHLEPPAVPAACGLIAQAADAVAYAHRHGIIHRDIKPQNLMVDRAHQVYVLDFGLAKSVDSPLSQTGAVMGTPAYMPPEQALGQLRDLDHRADIYSLGATLYRLLTGRPPFDGEGAVQILYRVCHEPLIPPRRLNPNVPPPLERIVLKAMARHREGRFRSMEEFAQALRLFLDGKDPLQPASAPAAQPPRWMMPGGLFGRIAVQQGFATPAQIEECLAVQENLRHTGTAKPLGQIMLSRNYLTPRQLNAILRIQVHRERRQAEKQLAQWILERGLLTPAQVDQAAEQCRQTHRTLEEVLLQRGLLTAAQLREFMNRPHPSEAGEESEVRPGLRECPNCLEEIPQLSDPCPKCGFATSSLRERPTCAGCRSVLASACEVCPECGADPASGVKAADRARRCDRCGKYSAATRTSCASCATAFWKSSVRRAAQKVRRLKVARALVIALPLVFAAWHHRTVLHWLGRALGGEAYVVRRECTEFLEAVAADDFERAIQRVDPATAFSSVPELARAYLSCPDARHRLTDWTIREVRLDADRATVLVDAAFVCGDEPAVVRQCTLRWKHVGSWKLE